MKNAAPLTILALALAGPTTLAADLNLNVTSSYKAGSDSPLTPPTILVSGKNNKYDEILNDRLTFKLRARLTRGDKFNRHVAEFTPGMLETEVGAGDSKSLKDIQLEPWFGAMQSESLNSDWRVIDMEFHYQDPTIDKQKGASRSPITLCNDLLKSKTGAAREGMLKSGDEIFLPKAYPWHAKYWYIARARGRMFSEPGEIHTSGNFNALVRCTNLVGPKPQKKTRTVGLNEIGKGRKGKPLSEDPPFSTLSLDIEPSTAKVDLPGGMRCPVSLRLHGTMTAKREFSGRAVLFGSQFLAPPMALSYPKGGTRNIVVTYPIRWAARVAPAGKAAPGAKPNASPLSKDLHFTLNVVNGDDKVVGTTGRREIKVVCAKIPPQRMPPGPQSPAGSATLVLPPPPPDSEDAISDFDASIRKVERIAADRLKIWIYNSGPEPANSCAWTLSTERDGDSNSASESMDPIAPGQTVEIEKALDAPLADYSAAAVSLECAGESVGRSANNLKVLVQ